ncbi:hypothetical protein HY628_02180, partial [Candidatus Uhrbacteria bacterium]|nr:hypothetical protein [Candidatus Uhrbacteria bacterium]
RYTLPLLLVGLVLTAGLVNEIVENTGDRWLGTNMFGQIGEADDTTRDLAYNVLGILLGTAMITRWQESFSRFLRK